jgi:hypothetical protein
MLGRQAKKPVTGILSSTHVLDHQAAETAASINTTDSVARLVAQMAETAASINTPDGAVWSEAGVRRR